MRWGAILAAMAAGAWVAAQAAARTAAGGGFNIPGNILISDQFNNRVIEVSRSGQIVWSFGSGNPNLCNPGPGVNGANQLNAPYSAMSIGDYTGLDVPPGF
jgi:hypothetical protein